MKYLGFRATDKITGFTGIITGFAGYLTGCNQYLINSKADDSGKFTTEWFDEQRLVIDESVKPVVLDNGETPGSDTPAPKR